MHGFELAIVSVSCLIPRPNDLVLWFISPAFSKENSFDADEKKMGS